MFQNDLIDPLILPNYNPKKFNNIWDTEDNFYFWYMIEFNNNLHRY